MIEGIDLSNIITGEMATWLRFVFLTGIILLGFWKALPSVLDAFERRQSGIETRTEALLDAQTKRFNEQLAQADDRHEECMKGQQVLRDELDKLRGQYNEVLALMAQMRQGALTVETKVAEAIKEAREG